MPHAPAPPRSSHAPPHKLPQNLRGLTPPARRAETGDSDPLADTPVPTAADLAVTRRLSRRGGGRSEPKPPNPPGYRLRSLIGRGAFGAVWLADEAATGKKVAVKTFRQVRALDWPLLTREVEKLAALDASRHVVRLLAVGWEADPPYYVMEYLPDGSLADRLAADGPVTPARAAELAEGIAAGLVHAHGAGILHCDLKPGNVLLDGDGQPRLCDFGQARGVTSAAVASGGRQPSVRSPADAPGERNSPGSHTGTHGPALGTLFYMPPEQTLPHAAPDARWDVYALGAVLYEALTGTPPHRTDELAERLRGLTPPARLTAYREALRTAPAPGGHRDVRKIDAGLVRIVDRCLARDPADRYPNAQAVRTALARRREAAQRRSRVRWAVFAPAALAAVLIPVGAAAGRRTVDAAKTQVVNRALDANALSARVVARSLEREVARKREELEALAADPAVRTLVAAAAGGDWREPKARSALAAALDARTTFAGEPVSESAAVGGPDDISWFLQDATGVTRWRDPADDDVTGNNFVWRDYFHGLAGDLPPDTKPGGAAPITATHVSLPYLSTSTSEWKLALSTPVRNDAGDIVAVLARTTLLDRLLEEYATAKRGITGSDEPAAGGGYSRVIALYERRTGEPLDHPRFGARSTATAADLRAARLPTDPVTVGRLAAGYRTDRHVDPVATAAGGGTWLAAFAPVGGTDWVAVVQEPREAALRPIDSLRNSLLRTGAAAVGGVAVALAILFMWLTRDRADG